ncbi:hypothetical protein Q7P37_002914 [Cladosporium fusiforme]
MQLDEIFASRGYIGFVVCLTIFTDVFTYGVIVPVMPHALHFRAGVGEGRLQAWNTAFMASYAGMIFVGSVFFASLGHRFSSLRWSFIAGQTMLFASILVYAFARSLPLLVIARLIQGFSCGAVFTAGYPLLYDAVGSQHIGRALGYTSMSLSLGFFTGPIVGGFLYDAAGFEMVFAPSILLTGVEVILRFLVVEPTPYDSLDQQEGTRVQEPQSQQQPLLGQRKETRGMGKYDPVVYTSSPTRCTASYGTSTQDGSLESSRFPSSNQAVRILLCHPRFLTAMVALFMVNCFTGSFEAIIPVFTYERFGFTSSQTAMVFLCITIPMVCSPISGYLCDRFGSRGLALSGFMLWGPTMIGMLLVDDMDKPQDLQLRYFLALLTLFGIGSALTFAPIYSEVSASVEEIEKEMPGVFGKRETIILAFGLENAAFGLGAMIGPLCAAILDEKYGFGGMSAVLGVLSLITCLPVALYTGSNASENMDSDVSGGDI